MPKKVVKSKGTKTSSAPRRKRKVKVKNSSFAIICSWRILPTVG